MRDECINDKIEKIFGSQINFFDNFLIFQKSTSANKEKFSHL